MLGNSETHQLLTLKQAAELGYGGYSTLRKRVADGSLPVERLGPRTFRVRLADLEALVGSPDRSPVGDSREGFDRLADAVARVVADAPPLSAAQRERLAVILSGAV